MSGWWVLASHAGSKDIKVCLRATSDRIALVRKPSDEVVSEKVGDFSVSDLLAVVEHKFHMLLDETEDRRYQEFMKRTEAIRYDLLEIDR